MADRYSFGHKALSVVLSVVLLGFGWPAVNPSETFASDESAQADQMQAEVAQPEETQALEETADDSAAMALATADEAAPVVASDEQAVAEPAADEPATAPAPSASGEEEASAVEDAVKEDSAVGSQSSSPAAAAQAKTEYDISLVLKNASIKKADGTDELVSLPATKVTVSADKDFKFTVVPDSACKLNRVLVNVAGQESPLTPDADGVYVVASSDIAKGATLTVEASSALGNVGTVLGGVLGGGSEVSASKDATVTATKDAADQALVYYLLDPTKDANSNDSGNWGAASLGITMVNTTGATWTGGKNCFDNVDQRVVSWPNGTNVVPRDSDAWNEIFDNYKTTIQAQLRALPLLRMM